LSLRKNEYGCYVLHEYVELFHPTQRKVRIRISTGCKSLKATGAEIGAARVPPETQVAWAKALEVDSQEFAKKLLSYYDPHTHKALFPRKR